MTADDFNRVAQGLNISRAELCRRLDIAPNTGTAYALNRQAIPRTVALACHAIMLDLEPADHTIIVNRFAEGTH